jgi:hypothetical protein
MLEESLTNPAGCLFAYRNVATGECDHDGIWLLLLTFWSAVRETFPEAWGKPPTQSRLMHGVGLRAMGKLMDRMMMHINPREPDSVRALKRELAAIAPRCRWTGGEWEDLGGMRWNELQNFHRHLSMLSNCLIRLHRHA